MTWSLKHTLISGLGLIALTNAVALVGVTYNRSGEPEAKLSLTQRELRTPYRWYGNRENSGLALSLIWRVLNPPKYKSMDTSERAGHPRGSTKPRWKRSDSTLRVPPRLRIGAGRVTKSNFPGKCCWSWN